MAKTLEQLIGAESLTAIIQDPKGGIPDLFLPPAFKTLTEQVDEDTAEWEAVEGQRKTAKLVLKGSPSKARDMKGVTKRTATLIHTFEHTHHSGSTLLKLQSSDARTQEIASRIVDNQVKAFRQGFYNLRLAAIYKALAAGVIYFDAEGNLLPTSSGALYTADFQIPANNKNQCNSLITATWATTSTPIISNINSLQKEAYKLTGLPLTHAFYGSTVMSNILSNTQCQPLLQGDPGFAFAMSRGTLPAGFAGIGEWHPVMGGFFEDNDGTIQDIFPADYCVFTPDPSPDWWGIFEGAALVPNALTVGSDVRNLVGNIPKTYGMFSYATLELDPVAIKHLAGDTFLPVIKVPKAIFIADVNF